MENHSAYAGKISNKVKSQNLNIDEEDKDDCS